MVLHLTVLFCSCCGYSILEIKCPYSLYDKSLNTEIESGRFYVGRNQSGYFLDSKHKYYFQVQLEIAVSGTSYCYFVVWTPEEAVIVCVEKDAEFINNMFQQCDLFWEKCVLPELLTRKLEQPASCSNTEEPGNASDTNSGAIYCIDQCEFPGEIDNMVGCDKCDNWFLYALD